MTATDKLLQLMSLCKCDLAISMDGDAVPPVSERLAAIAQMDSGTGLLDVPQDVIDGMTTKNCFILIQIWPDYHDPSNCKNILHHDLNEALDLAIQYLER